MESIVLNTTRVEMMMKEEVVMSMLGAFTSAEENTRVHAWNFTQVQIICLAKKKVTLT